jgi:hypothetical protein
LTLAEPSRDANRTPVFPKSIVQLPVNPQCGPDSRPVLDHSGTKSAIRAGFNRVHGRDPGGSSTCVDACRGGAGALGREQANTTNFRIALRTVSMFQAYLRTIEAPLSISLVSLPSEMRIAGDSMPTTSVKQIEKTPPCLPDNQAMTSLNNPAFADQSARWGERTLR